MDQYLQIAAKTLSEARRPLTPRAIIEAAYVAGIVPDHLHGQTQHKTLQARLSEDILARKERSLFFRTGPGQFFLRKFLDDQSIPIRYRLPMAARRRTRDLIRGTALTVSKRVVTDDFDNARLDVNTVLADLEGRFRYSDAQTKSEDRALVWSFTVVHRDNCVLSYRSGRYRDDRDEFANKRTIGFTNIVQQEHRTLFDAGTLGIVDSGIEAAITDLDISPTGDSAEDKVEALLKCFIWAPSEQPYDTLLAVVLFRCPRWFEPMSQRLSLNNLQWLDLSTPPNDLDDFDPWSQKVLQQHYGEFILNSEPLFNGDPHNSRY